MNPAEWIDYVSHNKDYLAKEIRDHMPETDFSNILPGLAPIVYLQKKHGAIELTFEAVNLEIDEYGAVKRADALTPAQ
jgi:hypothetical protein